MFNFKRRDSCFKCYASRETDGEGSNEISNILTKSINIHKILEFLTKIQLQKIVFFNKLSFEISNLNFAYSSLLMLITK